MPTIADELAAEVREELNVRAVELIPDESDMVERTLYPLLPVLGPRHGKAVGTDHGRRAERRLAAQRRRHRDRRRRDAPGRRVRAHRASPDRATRSPRTATCSWRSTPRSTRSSEAEGLAREVAHRLQAMRQAAGYEISDRIRIAIAADGTAADALRAHAGWLARRGPRHRAGARARTRPSRRRMPPDAMPHRRGDDRARAWPAPDDARSASMTSVEAGIDRDASLRPTILLVGTAALVYLADQVDEGARRRQPRPSRRSCRSSATSCGSGTSATTAPPSASFPARRGSSSRSRSSPSAWSPGSTAAFRDRGPWIHVVLGRGPGRDARQPHRSAPLRATSSTGSIVGIGDTALADLQRRGLRRRGRHRHPRALPDVRRRPDRRRAGRRMTAAVGTARSRGAAQAGRVDLAVAAVAEISRAHAQRLIGDGRALVDGRATALERPARGRRADHGRAVRAAGRVPRAGVDPAADRLRGHLDAHRRQAGRARRPSQRRPRHRDAGARPPRPRPRPRRATRVDRRGRAAGDRPSARQGDERAHRGRQDRCGPGEPHAPVRRAHRRQGVPRPRPRRGAGAARADRGADRPRPARPAADGGRGRRPRIGHRVRADRRRRRLHPPLAPSRSPGGRTRSARTSPTSGCRSPATCATAGERARWPATAVPARRPARHRAPARRGAAARVERAAAGPRRLPGGQRTSIAAGGAGCRSASAREVEAA